SRGGLDPPRQHGRRRTPDGGGAGGRAGQARGERWGDARNRPGNREHRRTIRVGGCTHPQRRRPRSLPDSRASSMNLPMLGTLGAPLMLENIPALQEEIRALAEERDALILAHNYQLPEVQDV